jgi:hypothetical protein
MTNFKTGGMADIAAKALFGSKSLSPAQLEYINKYVTRHGHSKVTSNRGFWKGLALGNENAKNLMRARYLQGGLLGKGGIILGEVAPNDAFLQSARNLKEYLKAAPGTPSNMTRQDLKNLAGGGVGLALGGGFMLGYPALEAYHAAKGKSDTYGESRRGSGVGGALGGGLGFLLSGGFGLPAGLLASHLGRKAGEGIGSVFDTKSPEVEMNTQYPGIAQQALPLVAGVSNQAINQM